MNPVLDFIGVVIYYVLNIVLLPIFLMAQGVILLMIFEKYAEIQVKKFMLRQRNRTYEPLEERRIFAFIRKSVRVSH